MIMNIIVILLVLGLAYAWMIRGVFNSLLHLLCVVVAGAIAFGVWEPIALKLIAMSPERGFLSFVESVAFGVALIVPFVVSLVILRAATDKIVSGNIKNNGAVDYAGGAICGLSISVITTGILIIGIGSMRFSTNFFGYQPIFYSEDRATGAGALVRADTLWIPADKIVAMIYGNLSNGTMSTSEPLAKWYPELELVGFAGRISAGDGSGRNAINPDDFKITSTYTVGNTNGSEKMSELLVDYRDDKPQKYLDVDSEPVTNGYIAGYVIEFEPGAKERGKKGGNLVISNGHFRLVVENEDGETKSVFPIATVSESSTPDTYGRWRFDSKDVFITSVGAKSRIPMAFEFVVPQGFSPISLSVRNARVLTDSMPDPVDFANPQSRDKVVTSGSLLKGESGARKLDNSKVVRVTEAERPNLLRSSTALSQMMSTQVARRGFTIDDDNLVIDGEHVFDMKTEVGRRNAGNSRKLRVEKFFVGPGQRLLKVEVGADSAIGFFSDAASEAPLDVPLLLIDDNGNEYEAVGYEYQDTNTYQVRYTRGSTLTGINETPNMSKSRDDQKLMILFMVTNGVNISHFTIGDVAVARFTPPYDTDGD